MLVVVPSLLTGAYTIYSAQLDSTIKQYLENAFVFSGTQVVQSSVDKQNRTIRVALVGMTIPKDTIDLLQTQLEDYGLDGYTLEIAQNALLDTTEDSDKITIAVQENTINELQHLLETQQMRINELEDTLAANIDLTATASKAEQVFADYLTECSCGIISEHGEEYFLLIAKPCRELTEDEQSLIENWMRSESGSENVKLMLYA